LFKNINPDTTTGTGRKKWQLNKFYNIGHGSYLKLMEQQEFSRVFSFSAKSLTHQKILKNINFLSPHCNFKNLNPDSTTGTGRKKMASKKVF
jgi:hypothetical protein